MRDDRLLEAPWPWESNIIGRDDPVVGTVRRICNGTGRDGEVRVMGVMEIVGVATLIGMLPDCPMRACSVRGGDVLCMMICLLIVLVERCFIMVVAKLTFDGCPDLRMGMALDTMVGMI